MYSQALDYRPLIGIDSQALEYKGRRRFSGRVWTAYRSIRPFVYGLTVEGETVLSYGEQWEFGFDSQEVSGLCSATISRKCACKGRLLATLILA